MSTKLNAEELAASIYAKMQRSHEREMYIAAKDLLGSGYIWEYYISAASDFLSVSSSAIEHACAAAIREVAQPIADERDELREALERVLNERDELREALEDVLAGWELMISAYGYDPSKEPEGSINQRARAILAKYPRTNDPA